jgi:hypothetical protein
MIGREGHDVRRLRQRHPIMSMKEVGTDPGDRAAIIERDCPESPHMIASGKLVLIHKAKWPGISFRERNSTRGQTLRQSFDEVF